LMNGLRMNCSITVLKTDENSFGPHFDMKLYGLMKRNQDSETITKIGMMLKDCHRIAKDLKRSQACFKRAMSMGNAEATFQLGE